MQISEPTQLWMSYPTRRMPGPTGNRVEAEAEDPAATLASQANALLLGAGEALLSEAGLSGSPDVFVDCRSAVADVPAPTYKSAFQLAIPRAVPFSLQGQNGSELALALLLLDEILALDTATALITTTHCLPNAVEHPTDDRFAAGTASAAVLVAQRRIGSCGLRVQAIGLGQAGDGSRSMPNTIRQLWDAMAQRQRMNRSGLTWGILHTYSARLTVEVQAMLPLRWFARSEHAEQNFGCADPLISLHALAQARLLNPGDDLMLWALGTCGTVGMLLFEVEG